MGHEKSLGTRLCPSSRQSSFLTFVFVFVDVTKSAEMIRIFIIRFIKLLLKYISSPLTYSPLKLLTCFYFTTYTISHIHYISLHISNKSTCALAHLHTNTASWFLNNCLHKVNSSLDKANCNCHLFLYGVWQLLQTIKNKLIKSRSALFFRFYKHSIATSKRLALLINQHAT